MKSVMCYYKKRKRKKKEKNGHETYRKDFRNSVPLFAPAVIQGSASSGINRSNY